MTMASKPAPEQGSHFWFMSIQTPNAQGYYMSNHHGHATPLPDETRYDLFLRLISEVNHYEPRTVGGTVLAFDVQPNQI